MTTIDPTTAEGRARIRAIAVDAPEDRAVLLTRQNVAALLDAIEHARTDAAREALEGFAAWSNTPRCPALSPPDPCNRPQGHTEPHAHDIPEGGDGLVRGGLGRPHCLSRHPLPDGGHFVNTFLVKHLKNQARPQIRRAYPSTPMEPLDIQVGDAVRFYGVRTSATIRTVVRAVTEHYVLCTWPSAKKGETEYTIISWRDGWRGPHGSWGYGASTDEECRETLAALEAGEIEMSHRNAVYLDISQVIRDGNTIFDDTEDETR